jgi:surface antigen
MARDLAKGRAIAVVIAGLSIAGCAGDPYNGTGPKENTGTLVGAVTGAVAGAAMGGRGGDRVAGAVIGAALGGLLGNRIGAALDDQDRAMAYDAQMRALESGRSGAPVGWRNPDSGRYGSVVPGAAFQRSAQTCRPFTHTIYIDGRPEASRGTACRNPDGTWTAVG